MMTIGRHLGARRRIAVGFAALVGTWAAVTCPSYGAGEAGDVVGHGQAERGELMFTDDFERSEIGGEWIEHFHEISLQDGVLVTKQLPREHAAIARHPMPLRNAMIFDYDLRFVDAQRAVFVVNGENKHVFHVSFREVEHGLEVSVQDYANGRANAIAVVPKKKGAWLAVTLVLVEDRLEALVDGASVVTLKSPGLATVKDLFQFFGAGNRIEHDNVEVWSIAP